MERKEKRRGKETRETYCIHNGYSRIPRTAHHLRHKRSCQKMAPSPKKIILALFDSLWPSIVLVPSSRKVALYLSLFFPPPIVCVCERKVGIDRNNWERIRGGAGRVTGFWSMYLPCRLLQLVLEEEWGWMCSRKRRRKRKARGWRMVRISFFLLILFWCLGWWW